MALSCSKKTLLHKKNFESSGYFYCLNCLNCFMMESKLKIHKKICKNRDFCSVEMLSEKNNILKFSQHEKLDKMPYIIYVDLECLVKRIKGCEKILKYLQLQKLESISLADIQCQQCGDMTIQKTNILYIVEKIA